MLGGDKFHRQGNLVPGGGNSIGFEEMKILEAYEFLDSIADQRPHEPGFETALTNAGVTAAMLRSWDSERWETVKSLRID